MTFPNPSEEMDLLRYPAKARASWARRLRVKPQQGVYGNRIIVQIGPSLSYQVTKTRKNKTITVTSADIHEYKSALQNYLHGLRTNGYKLVDMDTASGRITRLEYAMRRLP